MSISKIGEAVSSVANFLAGAESTRPTSPEYLDVDGGEASRRELFLVSYGSYGILPSFDPDCLTAICWLRICQIDFSIEDSNEPEMSPTRKLPFLMYSTGKTIAETEIKEFAAQRAGRLDSTTKGQVAIAAITLLNKSIRPALMAALWLEEPSRSKLTKRNYMRNIPWPVSDLLAWKQRRSIKGEVLYGKAGIKQLISDALESMRTLSELLGGSEYFGGGRPAHIDAVAYGLLAVALVILAPSHELRLMIETCSNLRSLVGRLRREYFDNPQ